MSEMTVEQAIHLALQHQASNQLAEAEEIFRQIIAIYPDQADAHHLMGALYLQAQKPHLAEPSIRKAISIRPEPTFSLSLGLALQYLNRFPEAIHLYQTLVLAKPDFIEGWVHLGVVLSTQGRFEEAALAFQDAIRLSPGHVQAQGNLGIVLCHLQRYDEAIWVLRAALARSPKSADFHASLAAALFGTHQLEAALAECREAVVLNPQHAHAQNLLALILRTQGKHAEAVEPAQLAADLMPENVDVQVNFGESLRHAQKLDEAEVHYRRVLSRNITSANLHNNLGNVFKDQGLLDDAIEQYKNSLAIHMLPSTFSNMIYTMQYHPAYSPEMVYKQLQRYNEAFADPLKKEIRPHGNVRDPKKKLRIGYISTEFRQHALGLNLVPLLTRHDKSQFEIYCYADVDKADFYTFRLRQTADKWTETHGKNDEQIAEMVRQDGIDILLDLHQHMAGSRLMIYARKPAPVQIAFAGYPGSTGLKTIDYRLTDPYLEPLEGPQQPSSEIALRLPHSFWCFHPVIEIPVNELPALKNGYITFGNLNNFCKVNNGTLELWAEVMRAVENSRLVLLAPEGRHRDRTRAFLSNLGIGGHRVEFLSRTPTAAYYKYYHQIDLALDSFPCNGHTTGMDCFFMGVPVTSIEGDRLFGRATWSQANNLGMPELVGKTDREFVELSIALAKDLPRLAGIRGSLRERMRNSPLMDNDGFARGIEAAYRNAWNRWCESPVQ